VSALVRVTVVGAAVTAELVVPAGVPLAEVVPDLARSVGLLDAETVHAGYRVETEHGQLLTPDAGLAAQGVPAGAVLVVRTGGDEGPLARYDDVLTTLRARRSWPWRRRGARWPGAARRTSSGHGARAP
jgi:hypothetical protein